MIQWLIVHIKLLLFIVLNIFKIGYLAVKSFIYRIKTGWWKRPHYRTFDGVMGGFGSGKNTFVSDYVIKQIKRYGKLNFRILTNIDFNYDALRKYGATSEKFRKFTNVDDIEWLMETKIDEKTGKKVPAFDWGLFIVDELCAVMSSRDFMNNKKGKGVVTKSFLSLTHQLRKFNVRGFGIFQDDGFDIAVRRIMDNVYCPHMHLLDRFNIIKVYKARALFAYLDDPNSNPPQYLNKIPFICTDEVFNFFDTHQLVETIAEGDYFRPNDADNPGYTEVNAVVVSSGDNKKRSFSQKLFGNKSV